MAIDFNNIDAILQQSNLADGLDEETLVKISDQVCTIYEEDLDSRKEWSHSYEEWIKLAIQVMEEKTTPWPNAANVKFPLLSTAAMQFHARSYPILINGPNIVKALIVGEDPDEEKAKRAERISKHMSYQLLEEMEQWDEDMDRLCYVLPIVGCAFKKIYYDPTLGHNVSELILAKDLVVNYWARSLKEAYAKTHVFYKLKNKVKEKVNEGTYLEINLDMTSPRSTEMDDETQSNQGLSPHGSEEHLPLMFLEQHTFYDLDDDGYEEPYIITVEYSTKKVVRITARFEKDGVVTNDGEIERIVPEEHIQKFSFIPNPDGGFYDIGFGALLGPLNLTVNTLLNQLIDSGTIHNLGGGFISRGIRMKAGDTKFTPGEYKFVQTAGDDLKKNIFPLPTKEPSKTLFELLGSIVDGAKELSSVSEIMVGKMPGQNTPATTTMASVEQGMKVFTAIYKRIYRSLTKEYKRLYRLNSIYLKPEEVFRVLDDKALMTTGVSDYQQDDTDVRPMADPSAASEMLRLTKAQALLELIPLGLNVSEVLRRVLEAQDQPEVEKLINPEGPQPDPKQQELQMKMQMEQAKGQRDDAKAQIDLMTKKQDLSIKEQGAQIDNMSRQMDLMIKQQEAALKYKSNVMDATLKAQKGRDDVDVSRAKGAQDIRNKQELFEIKKKEQALKKENTKSDNKK